MEKIITRTFCLDGDICDVVFHLDEACGKYFGDYPDFKSAPRYTKSGYPWAEAIDDGCPYMESMYPDFSEYTDCGSCKYFCREKAGDLIGICQHKKLRKPCQVEKDA